MKIRHCVAVLILGLALCARAEISPVEKPFVHGLFTDNMVLQRDVKCPIWGWSQPGSTVTVEMNGGSDSAVADASGRWETSVGPFPAGGPYDVKITGAKTATLKNVLMGDVWLASGQSNMQMGVKGLNQWWDEQGTADLPQVRLVDVPVDSKFVAPYSVDASWRVCSRDTVFGNKPGSDGFSAIAFLFGRQLYQELKIPIGLIQSCWGATSISNWSSPAVIKDTPSLAGMVPFDEFKGRVEAAWRTMDPSYDEALKKVQPGFDATGWNPVTLPRVNATVPASAVEWYRKEIAIPESWVGQDLIVSLGAIDGTDTLWWNGTWIDSFSTTDNHQYPRFYKIPGSLVSKGPQLLAMRTLVRNGFLGTPEQMTVKLASGEGEAISLAGEWLYQEGTPREQLAKARYPERRSILGGAYQAMIAPLAPFAIKGVIWYQGEGDVGRAGEYYSTFSRMIADWRELFGVSALPFYFVQLAGFGPQPGQPVDSGWAWVRDSQRRVAADVPNTGMAVAIDRGEIYNIHPPNKQDVAKRLALAALAGTYGKDVAGASPAFDYLKREGTALRLEVKNAGGSLISKGGAPTGFAIAGADKKYVWAQAVIEGSSILLSAPGVVEPMYVRYGWADNPVCNVYGGNDLPLCPFNSESL